VDNLLVLCRGEHCFDGKFGEHLCDGTIGEHLCDGTGGEHGTGEP